MNELLKKAGVRQITKKGCSCRKTLITYVYSLPIKLNPSIVPLLKPIGKPGASFEKTSLLRVETKNVSIVGVKRLKEIKLIFKKNNDSAILNQFENILVEFLNLK